MVPELRRACCLAILGTFPSAEQFHLYLQLIVFFFLFVDRLLSALLFISHDTGGALLCPISKIGLLF